MKVQFIHTSLVCTSMMSKTVCIIGAGVSGLASLKQCLEEAFKPTCYEKDDDIGGIWNFTDTPRDGYPSIYKSCVMNSSKEMTCFSDFPFPRNFPIFPQNKQFKIYLNDYVSHFGLRKYIHFKTEVQKVERASDFEQTGRWIVTSKNSFSGKVSVMTFDYIMVCSGHYTSPIVPVYHGMERFKGSVLHSHDYKTVHGFEDRNILVVGFGNSALDIACELCRHAKIVYISSRKGSYAMPKVFGNREPWDQHEWTRFNQFLNIVIPQTFMRPFVYRLLNRNFSQSRFGIAPNMPFTGNAVIINDELFTHLLSGEIIMKPAVSEFFEDFVTFSDGTKTNIDTVIFGTGYTFSYAFLTNSDFPLEGYFHCLYKSIIPVGVHQASLAVIGLVRIKGPHPPLFEMQARWATQIFNGKVCLPNNSIMSADVELRKNYIESTCGIFSRHAMQYNYLEYMDELACEIGCKPNLWKYLITNFSFFLKLTCGPILPQHYRLEGRGSWSNARTVIESHDANVWFALRTRKSGLGEIEGLYEGWTFLLHICVVTTVMALSVALKRS